MATLPTSPVLAPQAVNNPNYNPAAAAGTAGSLDPSVITPPTPTTPAAVPITAPAAGGTAPVPTPVTTPVLPSTPLQPGNTGDGVKAVQDYLVANGYMTQDQVNTGYGTYGPQTTAAVKALQQKLGIDNSSGPGYFGPKTIAAISAAHPPAAGTGTGDGTGGTPSTTTGDGAGGTTETTTTDPYSGMNPIQKQTAMYHDAYKALGLSDVKTQLDGVLKQQADLNNELQGKILDINNNPWLSEGIRTTRIQKLQDSYKTRVDTLTHLQTLYDSMYKTGTAQVDKIVTGANADAKAISDLAQKQIDAANALAKDNQVVSVNGREVLVNRVTGKQVADLGPSTKGTAAAGTAAERQQSTIDQASSLFAPGMTIPGSGGIPYIDNNGNATPEGWKTVMAASGLPRATFIREFGNLLVHDNIISPKFGLTPVEMKAILGALPTA